VTRSTRTEMTYVLVVALTALSSVPHPSTLGLGAGRSVLRAQHAKFHDSVATIVATAGASALPRHVPLKTQPPGVASHETAFVRRAFVASQPLSNRKTTYRMQILWQRNVVFTPSLREGRAVPFTAVLNYLLVDLPLAYFLGIVQLLSSGASAVSAQIDSAGSGVTLRPLIASRLPASRSGRIEM